MVLRGRQNLNNVDDNGDEYDNEHRDPCADIVLHNRHDLHLCRGPASLHFLDASHSHVRATRCRVVLFTQNLTLRIARRRSRGLGYGTV